MKKYAHLPQEMRDAIAALPPTARKRVEREADDAEVALGYVAVLLSKKCQYCDAPIDAGFNTCPPCADGNAP